MRAKKDHPRFSKNISELRQDLVSRDWIVIATGRAKRPHVFAKPKKVERQPEKNCPFEDPQKSGNLNPILIQTRTPARHLHGKSQKKPHKDIIPKNWFVQIFPNKFPAFGTGAPDLRKVGPYDVMDGVGFHEILVTRDHDRTFAQFSQQEATLVLASYRARYHDLEARPNVRYVSVFHNWGRASGASVYHPHSQILAIPVIPGEVARSLEGSDRYFRENKSCVHCDMVRWERKEKVRIVYENDDFIAVCPFVSRTAYEVRIFPKRHSPDFDSIYPKEILSCADALRISLRKIWKALANPSYNFYIHTAPCEKGICPFYHWHIEILPKVAVWAGFEIATGIEISSIDPAHAARHLRKY